MEGGREREKEREEEGVGGRSQPLKYFGLEPPLRNVHVAPVSRPKHQK